MSFANWISEGRLRKSRGGSIHPLAVLTLVVGLIPSCYPPMVASRYEFRGVASDSVRAIVPAVASNFGWPLAKQDSLEILKCGYACSPVGVGVTVVVSEGSFVVAGYDLNHQVNDLVASCIIQEHRIRSGLQEPMHPSRKSHLTYAGAVLVSPILGGSYLTKNDPFRPQLSMAWYVVHAGIDLVGLALLFFDDTREAGFYTLAGIRVLHLPFGLHLVSEFNRKKRSRYDIGLMGEDSFPLLGLKVVKRTYWTWP